MVIQKKVEILKSENNVVDNPFSILVNNPNIINLEDIKIPKPKYLSFCNLRYKGANEGIICIKDGSDLITVQAGDAFIHLCTRESVRKKDGEGYVDRVIKPIRNSFEKKELWRKAVENVELNKSYSKGFTHLVTIKAGENWYLATIEAYNTLETYYLNLLKAGEASKNRKSIVGITSHKCNQKVSKNGHNYYVSYKFTQFKSELLTKQDYQEIGLAYKDKKDPVEKWLAL